MKVFAALFVTLLLTTGCTSTQPNNIHLKNCEKTLQEYITYRDAQSAADYRSVFTDNATFTIPALKISLTGADDIVLRQQQAISKTKSMHMMTSANIKHIKSNLYEANSYFVLHQQAIGQPHAPTTIFNGTYEDILIVQNSRCLIKSRQVNIIKKQVW
ncbi:hypothetical protein EAG18_07030 [Pseudoalteromonas sp. J010]|uniref:nuclear transport factor 2 family protein n=1 Tax=Pseudoalteromonas sp. J010 TaxID=998465 RepID=UPI000F6540DF|nr:nuclear transport factor 2 family protein [Pseudoalteromonas sp. J010]RRS09189.1 hypothetical protein EAG18_07030 [Pseudoalteromonas sp. J010]